MGHWSELCGISGLPITGGSDIGMLILSKNKRGDLNSGAFIENNVVTLPILGRYDDYGGIENIQNNNHIGAIENNFGAPIQEIVNIITDRGQEKKSGKLFEALKNYTYMFFRKEVYDELIQLYGTKQYESNRAYFNCEMNIEMLSELGFKFKSKDEKRERYNQLYTNPKYKGVKVWSDGTWMETEYNGLRQGHMYCPADFEGWLNKLEFKADFSYLKLFSDAVFIIRSLNKWVKKIDSLSDKDRVFSVMMDSNQGMIPFGTHRQDAYEESPLFNLYKKEFLKGDIDKEIIDWYNLWRCCMKIGVQFRNTQSTVAQDGDYVTMERIGKVMVSVCKERDN